MFGAVGVQERVCETFLIPSLTRHGFLFLEDGRETYGSPILEDA